MKIWTGVALLIMLMSAMLPATVTVATGAGNLEVERRYPFHSTCQDSAVLPVTPWQSYPNPPVLVTNNVWGGKQEPHRQCIWLGGNDGSLFGWNLTREAPSTTAPYYPEVVYGKNPWSPWFTRTTDKLPAEVKSITSLEVSLAASTGGYRKYNLAFDLWITNSSTCSEADLMDEIMIWLIWTPDLQSSLNTNAPEVSDGYNVYNLNTYTVAQSFGFTIFSIKTQGIPSKINILALLAYLMSKGHNLGYLASIELGNEVWSGTGRTVVKTFRVDIATTSSLNSTGFGLVLDNYAGDMQNIYTGGGSAFNSVDAPSAIPVMPSRSRSGFQTGRHSEMRA